MSFAKGVLFLQWVTLQVNGYVAFYDFVKALIVAILKDMCELVNLTDNAPT